MTTSSGVDTSEMKLIHQVIRREVVRLPGMFRQSSGIPGRVPVIAAHAREMLSFLHVHHAGEDELLYPLLSQRVAVEQELIDRMEAQHRTIADAVSSVEADLGSWSTRGDAATGEAMAAQIERVSPTLLDHLSEEEQHILPLASAHLSQDEWNALGKDGFSHIQPKRRLVVLGYILDGPEPAETERFLKKNVPPPARVAYKLIGRRQYQREVASLDNASS